MAGSIPTLSAITLTPAEIASGFTANPTGTGFDVSFSLAGALLDLKSSVIKLVAVAAMLPTGANATAVAAQIDVLTNTGTAPTTALDGGSASTTFTLPGVDGGASNTSFALPPISGGTA